jgi:hypothetical protein
MKLIATLVLFAVSVFAADVTGKWTATQPAGKKGGQGKGNPVTFNLKAEGDKLTGSIDMGRRSVPIVDGKINGDEISFSAPMKTRDQEVKVQYRGKVVGDEIQFTRTREGARRSQEFTAKKAN